VNFSEMSVSELETRLAAIGEEINADDADLDALEDETRSIKAEMESRKQAEVKRNEIRDAVANGAGETKKEFEKEERETMTIEELRSSKAYAEAYANYIKTGRADECRALLSENAPDPSLATSGLLPVPSILEEGIKTAWENDQIMSRVRRSFVRGNLIIGFEVSATGAEVHDEGDDAPDEETLVLGKVALVPETIKKLIRISTEVAALGGEAFLEYIRDELTYQIVKEAAKQGILDIVGAPATSNTGAIGVDVVTASPTVITIPAAAAYLADDAQNVCVIMNRQTEADFLAAQAGGGFSIDPFAGLPRVYTSALPSYSVATTGVCYAIVGDLNGLQYNFPEGADVKIVWDEYSEAEKDLVKIVGRQYAGHGVTKPGAFVKIVHEA
jgi:HK97 family phage major capsid protein